MTTFIFERRKPFSGSKSRWCRFLAVFSTLLVFSASSTRTYAAHLPSSKERAQGDALYQEAFAAYQAGDYAQAQTLIEKADTLKPDQPDGWNLRGMVYLKRNAFNKAETAFTRAITLDPKLWAAQFNLAETPFQGKDYARARTRFEKLLDQTDHFREPKQWELVQYKAFLSCLLMGDNAGALKKLGKLPANGGATPAYLYAEAAIAFHRKDDATARKALTAAQSTFPPLLNDLFTDSLVEAGWQSPLPPPVLAANGPGPGFAPSASGSSSTNNHTPVAIDPRLEASAAEPLPSGDSAVHAVLGKVNSTPSHPAVKAAAATPAPQVSPTPKPAVATDRQELLLE